MIFGRWLLAAVLGCALAAPDAAAQGEEMRGTPLLAKKTAKKKKKKKSDSDPFGPEDIEAISDSDQGVGIHREQEGVDTPYIAEIAGLTQLSLLSTEPKDGDATSSTLVSLGGQWLFILGPLQVGPDIELSYSKYSKTVPVAATATSQATTETLEATAINYAVGGVFKFNFANIDRSLTVPFVYAGLGLRGGQTKVGDGDPAKTSGFQVKGGGGLNMFVDSNVAFVPRGELVMITNKAEGADGAEGEEETTTGVRLFFGIAVFI